jgi:hypothetical protein
MMADNKMIEFDTWVLRSVILANVDGKGTTERILAAANLMSKTPMIEADLRNGLTRLVQKGFVDQREGRYSITSAVPDNIKWSETEKIRRLLETEPPAIEKKAATDDLGKLAGDYVKRFQGFMSGLTKPKKE